MKEELASLIERIADRDRRAFEELYRLTSRKMFAVAMRIVREPGVAQDVIQDSYIRLWRYAHTFNAKLSAPETWLHQVVRNRALDLISQQGHALNCISIDQFADSDDGESNALLEEHAHHAEEGDSGQVMRDCVQKLEGKYRQVLTLAYNHGMSHAEIADHLDVPLGTVKTWARRGLIELKAVYDQYQSELTAMSMAAVNKHRQDAEHPGFMA